MTNIKISATSENKVVSDREIADLCTLVGRPIPADYMKFLREHGACSVEPYTFITSCPTPGTKRDLREFIAFKDDAESILDIRGLWRQTRSEVGMPDSWLPFATEYAGGVLCLDLITGGVYFRDYTYDYSPEQSFVAHSFAEFMNSLFRDE